MGSTTTTTAVDTAEAPAAVDTATQLGPSGKFTVTQELRAHAANLLSGSFHDSMGSRFRTEETKLSVGVHDFIAAVDHLAHYLLTGQKPAAPEQAPAAE